MGMNSLRVRCARDTRECCCLARDITNPKRRAFVAFVGMTADHEMHRSEYNIMLSKPLPFFVIVRRCFSCWCFCACPYLSVRLAANGGRRSSAPWTAAATAATTRGPGVRLVPMWCAVLLDALASPLNGVLLLTAAGPAATAFLTEEEGSCSSLLADALRSPAQTLLLNSFRSDPQAVSLASVRRGKTVRAFCSPTFPFMLSCLPLAPLMPV